ncbi:hypothetical protein VNI00_019226 [Paramarasmius palmivorus]|uniref:Uncharacterized protein n=1 Tax=Paramarasmius palmivorus TaxID=297713 RepID=A0AAW0APF6_9AGAR
MPWKGMAVPSHETWSNHLLGSFVVLREDVIKGLWHAGDKSGGNHGVESNARYSGMGLSTNTMVEIKSKSESGEIKEKGKDGAEEGDPRGKFSFAPAIESGSSGSDSGPHATSFTSTKSQQRIVVQRFVVISLPPDSKKPSCFSSFTPTSMSASSSLTQRPATRTKRMRDDRYPVTIVHKHSKCAAFSLSRHHRFPPVASFVTGAQRTRGHIVFLASRRVQEQCSRYQDARKGTTKMMESGGAPANTGSSDNQQECNRTENNVFSNIPEDCLFMLLPLWPGETDAVSAKDYLYRIPQVSRDEILFLLTYYKPIEGDISETLSCIDLTGHIASKSRPVQIEGHTEIMDERNIFLSRFIIIARQVALSDLHGSGISCAVDGMAVSGPLEDAYLTAPHFLQSQLINRKEFAMGVCYSREAGIEFDPEVLIELGLCRAVKEDGGLPIQGDIDTAKLTPIGSAVVETAWAGSLAVTSFAPVS